MDSAALLDLLGNENRRRILRLLARKPCYVTEISEYLGVSPKAVIDHLRKLEEAGIVESRMDDRRRKYFHIARNLRLEVNVSPYGFGTKSAYPASRSLDITTCNHLSIDLELDSEPKEPAQLARELQHLEQLENELSLTQRWVQGRITGVLEQLTEELDGSIDADGRLYADILLALGESSKTIGELATAVDAPPAVVEQAVVTMADNGFVGHGEDGWQLIE
jgi:ArsR family transcriptional regulator